MSSAVRSLASAKFLPNPTPVCLIAYSSSPKQKAVPFYYDKRNQALDVRFVNGFTRNTTVDGDDSEMYVRANVENAGHLVTNLGNNFKSWYENAYGADSGTVKVYESGVVVKANVLVPNIAEPNSNHAFTSEYNEPISYDSAVGEPGDEYYATVLFKKALVITYKKLGVTKYRGFFTLFSEGNT